MFKVIKVTFDFETGNESEECVLHTTKQDFANQIRDEINAQGDEVPGHETFAVTIKV
jgi:hypothetical protein